MKLKRMLGLLAGLLVTASATAQMQVDMTPATGALKGGARKVVTTVFTAEMRGGKIVKTGKPDPWGEIGVYPQEAVQTYDGNGQLIAMSTTADGVETRYEYKYADGRLTEESRYDGGTLFSVRHYRYEAGKPAGMSEDMFIGGEKTTNDYPVDASKIKTDAAGNTIEYGYSQNDFVKRDKAGRLVEFSMYNEMDDYVEARTYTYDAQGRVTKITVSEGAVLTYTYDKTDAQGNWTRLIIRSDNAIIGGAERTITY